MWGVAGPGCGWPTTRSGPLPAHRDLGRAILDSDGWMVEFNRVRPRSGLLRHLESLEWPYPASVQVLIHDEEDDCFGCGFPATSVCILRRRQRMSFRPDPACRGVGNNRASRLHDGASGPASPPGRARSTTERG